MEKYIRRSGSTMPKQRRTFTAEFKRQMVQLFESGKSRADLVREYDLSASALDRWISQSQNTGSFTEKANRSPEENELLADYSSFNSTVLKNLDSFRTTFYESQFSDMKVSNSKLELTYMDDSTFSA